MPNLTPSFLFVLYLLRSYCWPWSPSAPPNRRFSSACSRERWDARQALYLFCKQTNKNTVTTEVWQKQKTNKQKWSSAKLDKQTKTKKHQWVCFIPCRHRFLVVGVVEVYSLWYVLLVLIVVLSIVKQLYVKVSLTLLVILCRKCSCVWYVWICICLQCVTPLLPFFCVPARTM